MTVGYAAFQTNLDIKGTSKVSSNWNVLITNVTESNKEGQAETVGSPTWTDLTAYMEANLYQKGDYVEYEVTVENRGTLDAKLESITDNIKTTNEAIKISFTGYTKGEKLYKNTSKKIIVKIEYNPEFNGTIEEGSSEISIDLNYTQNNDYQNGEDGEITSPERYLVTYDCTSNGGNNCSSYNEYLKEGDTVNLNNTSSKEGYEFVGWNTNRDSEEGLTQLEMPSEDITLYAIYKDITPPTCNLTITKTTIDSVTVKADCQDESGIKEYRYSINEGDYNVSTSSEYTFDSFDISTIKIEVADNVGNKKIFQINDTKLQEGYHLIYSSLIDKYNDLNERNNKYEEEFLNKTYPVGSIYITESNTNPSETIGGTWEEYGKGKTLVGVDLNDTNFNTVNKLGGSKTNTLAVTNLPLHTHSIPILSGTAAQAGAHTHNDTAKSSNITGSFGALTPGEHTRWASGAFSATTLSQSSSQAVLTGTYSTGAIYGYKFSATPTITMTNASAGAHTHSVSTTASNTGPQGSSATFSNISPYITVYIWKRIS